MLVVVLLLLPTGTACAATPEDPTPPRWVDGTVRGPWRSVFDGGGENTLDGERVTLAPQPATAPAVTHAGLVVSTATHRAVDYGLRLRTAAQLRQGSAPNPWEVAWGVWSYTDPQHFYYVTLKPNGWEIGKADPAYPGAQRFLATGPTPFPVGRANDVHVVARGATFTVSANGTELARVTDTERPYGSGAVGVYAEDAAAEFDGFEITGD